MTPQIAAFFAEIGLEATPELVAVSKELGLREGSDFIELDKDDVTSLQRCMPKIPGKRFKKKVEDLKVRRGPLSLRTVFSLRAPLLRARALALTAWPLAQWKQAAAAAAAAAPPAATSVSDSPRCAEVLPPSLRRGVPSALALTAPQPCPDCLSGGAGIRQEGGPGDADLAGRAEVRGHVQGRQEGGPGDAHLAERA